MPTPNHSEPCVTVSTLKEDFHEFKSSLWKVIGLCATIAIGIVGCTSVMTPYYLSKQDSKFEKHRELIAKEQESNAKNRENIVRMQTDIDTIKKSQEIQTKSTDSIRESIHRIELSIQKLKP